MYIFSILLLVPFLIFSFYLYHNVQNQIWAIIPIFVFIAVLLVIYIIDRLNFRLQNNRTYRKSELKGIHLDLNERVFKKIYFYLTKYEYIDEDRTSFQDFSNVLSKDFKENESVIHFNMNLGELKYILEYLKKLKPGLSLTTFEKSNKFFNKGKSITQKALTSAYSDYRPDREFRSHVDDFFKFLTDI